MNKNLQSILEQSYNKEIIDEIIKGYQKKKKTCLRINTLKITKDELLEKLNNLNIKYHEVEWYSNALVLDIVDEKILKEQDFYQNGEIYLQNLSSMLPPLFLDLQDNNDVLDMASSPGGKTSEIISLNNHVFLTAVEKNKIRYDRLCYNLEKLGVKRVNTMHISALDLDDFMQFDCILLDAPCSGSGTINLEKDDYFSTSLVKNSCILQEKLFKKALKLLKIGKTMVYSTCSILKVENEELIKKYIQKGIIEIIPINIPSLNLLPSTIDGVLTVMPTEEYEGFFMAKIKKIKSF